MKQKLKHRLIFEVLDDQPDHCIIRMRSWIPLDAMDWVARWWSARVPTRQAKEDPRLLRLGAPYRTRR